MKRNWFPKGLPLFLLLATACSSTSLLAQTYLQSEGGENFYATFNAHGAILKSDRATLYLGLSCDAWSPQYGGQNRGGVWRQWDDGSATHFSVSLLGYDILFRNQRLFDNADCPSR